METLPSGTPVVWGNFCCNYWKNLFWFPRVFLKLLLTDLISGAGDGGGELATQVTFEQRPQRGEGADQESGGRSL